MKFKMICSRSDVEINLHFNWFFYFIIIINSNSYKLHSRARYFKYNLFFNFTAFVPVEGYKKLYFIYILKANKTIFALLPIKIFMILNSL